MRGFWVCAQSMTVWEAARAFSARFLAGVVLTATAGVTPTANVGHAV